MSFDLSVHFFGLVLLCTSTGSTTDGKPYCPEGAYAYLVDVPCQSEGCQVTVCDHEVEISEHSPLLSFEVEDLVPGSTQEGQEPILIPDPSGSSAIGVIDLRGKRICLEIDWKRPRGRMEYEGFVRPGQKTPDWWRHDRCAFGWVPDLSSMKGYAGQKESPLCPLREEVTTVLGPPTPPLSAKVELPQGRLLAPTLMLDEDGNFQVWDLERGGSTYKGFQTLAGDVRLEVEDVSREVRIQECSGKDPVLLATLKDHNGDGEVRLRISNSPTKVEAASKGDPSHFYAYYSLLKSSGDESDCTMGCAVPRDPGFHAGAGSFCPPSSYP